MAYKMIHRQALEHGARRALDLIGCALGFGLNSIGFAIVFEFGNRPPVAGIGAAADNDIRRFSSRSRSTPIMANSFGSQGSLTVDGKAYTICRLAAVEKAIPRLPDCRSR